MPRGYFDTSPDNLPRPREQRHNPRETGRIWSGTRENSKTESLSKLFFRREWKRVENIRRMRRQRILMEKSEQDQALAAAVALPESVDSDRVYDEAGPAGDDGREARNDDGGDDDHDGNEDDHGDGPHSSADDAGNDDNDSKSDGDSDEYEDEDDTDGAGTASGNENNNHSNSTDGASGNSEEPALPGHYSDHDPADINSDHTTPNVETSSHQSQPHQSRGAQPGLSSLAYFHTNTAARYGLTSPGPPPYTPWIQPTSWTWPPSIPQPIAAHYAHMPSYTLPPDLSAQVPGICERDISYIYYDPHSGYACCVYMVEYVPVYTNESSSSVDGSRP